MGCPFNFPTISLSETPIFRDAVWHRYLSCYIQHGIKPGRSLNINTQKKTFIISSHGEKLIPAFILHLSFFLEVCDLLVRYIKNKSASQF